MITEANQYEVMAAAKQIERNAVKFNAFSLALSSVRNAMDASSIACPGATEATEMLSSYATSMIEEIMRTTEKGCANTIEIRRDQIVREISE